MHTYTVRQPQSVRVVKAEYFKVHDSGVLAFYDGAGFYICVINTGYWTSVEKDN